jgi:hypothetical protein
MKAGLNSYFEPTPKLMRKIGDALMTASVAITSYAAFAEKPWVVVISAILGVGGKVMTNFFSESK